MPKVVIARQPIFNVNGKIFGYELLFRNEEGKPQGITSNLMATSKVLLNALTHMDFQEVVGKDRYAFVNVDHDVLLSGIIDSLSPDHFVIELLEGIDLNHRVIKKIKLLHTKGFRFALDDFDCKMETIKKYNVIYKHIDYVKIDMSLAEYAITLRLIPRLHELKMKVLAEKVETQEEYRQYTRDGFDLFQGYYLKRPEVIEIEVIAETAAMTILHIIGLIRSDKGIDEIENYIRTKPDLSYNLLKHLNSPTIGLENDISSLKQAMNLLGRENLLRWLLIYLYSEAGGDSYSESIMGSAIKRALAMEEAQKTPQDKERAFLTGMFSMLDVLFGASFEAIFRGLPLEKEITQAISHRSGPLGKALQEAEKTEKDKLKEVVMENFDRFEIHHIVRLLDSANIKIKSPISK